MIFLQNAQKILKLMPAKTLSMNPNTIRVTFVGGDIDTYIAPELGAIMTTHENKFYVDDNEILSIHTIYEEKDDVYISLSKQDASNIKTARVRLGYTQSEIARVLGTVRNNVSMLESGNRAKTYKRHAVLLNELLDLKIGVK